MPRRQVVLLLLSVLLIVAAWLGVVSARQGLVVRTLNPEGVPMVFLAPKQRQNVPGVLVAHGFAGSKQLMLGYGYTLAQGDNAVLLWDFKGHGANPHPLDREGLQADLAVADRTLRQQPEVDPKRVALLGHSMGSSAVMTRSINEPDRFAATVAISPTDAAVSPQVPRNLQLQAGAWEGRFVTAAQALLQAAGGANPQVGEGRGRSLLTVPHVEHITILFSSTSHRAALTWINQTFGQRVRDTYVDRRMGWYGLHLLAWLGVLSALAPMFRTPTQFQRSQPWRRWVGLWAGPLAATVVLWPLGSSSGVETVGGIMVGGALGIWFLVAGCAWLGILGQWSRPTIKDVGIAVVVFLLLWVAFGAMAQVVWLQWWLIPVRLRLWPVLSLACLPWFLASGLAQVGIGPWKRVLWWLGQSGALIVGLILTIVVVPSLGFMAILLPVFPVLIAILSFTAAQLEHSWRYGIAAALFFGWAIAAIFPLAA